MAWSGTCRLIKTVNYYGCCFVRKATKIIKRHENQTKQIAMGYTDLIKYYEL